MKTCIVVGICLIVVVLAADQLPGETQRTTGKGTQEPATSGATPQSGHAGPTVVPATFPVGKQPYGMAFDGSYIWVANYASDTVSKLRPKDGAALGTFKVGRGPIGLVSDGANIWVTNNAGGSVSELRASDGKVLGTFNVGPGPFWPAFDGENVWVPNGPHTITKLRASDGKNLGDFTVGYRPVAAVFGADFIWVTNQGDGTVSNSGRAMEPRQEHSRWVFSLWE